ncbi:MAG: M23 family metallopeptidase, partial [Gemmatimonadota bacterium]
NPDLHPAANGLMDRRTLVFPLALALLIGAAALGARGNWPWQRLSDVPTARPIVVTNPFRVVRDTLQQGESVSALLKREGVTGLDLKALAAALRLDPTRIRAGLVFSVRRDTRTDEPTHVEFRPNPDERMRFVRTASGDWRGESVPVRWTTDTIRCSLTISSDQPSVYAALEHGVCDGNLATDERVRLAYQLSDINASTVDFSSDLQVGDHFVAVLERLVSEEGEVRAGSVLASTESVGRKTYQTFAYPDGRGGLAYYDENGAAVRRSFLISPVDFRYITSGFSLSRFHPILGLFRKHEGVDYSAASGSPVRAVADGVVLSAGWAGGYGRMIELRHASGIVTRYGHLSRIGIGIRPGARVKQNEVIGNVGASGLATGPHLHYEFRVDGRARDPRTIKSEPGVPLPQSALAEFQRRKTLLTELLGGALTAAPITE